MFLTKLATVAGSLCVLAAFVRAGLDVSNAGPEFSKRTLAPGSRSPGGVLQAEKPHVDRWGDPLPAGAIAHLGTVRFRIGDGGGFAVRPSLGFLPNNKTVVSLTGHNLVGFWEAGTGKLLREVSTGDLSIHGFALSADGKQFATAGLLTGNGLVSGVIGIWDIAAGRQVKSWQRTDKDVGPFSAVPHSMAFTPDGKLLVSLSSIGVLRIEEVGTGAERLRHQFPEDSGGSMVLSADGSLLAVASGANTNKLFVWKWQGAEAPRKLKVPPDAGHWMAFSPDGKTLAETSVFAAVIRLWDVASGRLFRKLESPERGLIRFHSVVFSRMERPLLPLPKATREELDSFGTRQHGNF